MFKSFANDIFLLNWYMRCIEIVNFDTIKDLKCHLNWYMRCIEMFDNCRKDDLLRPWTDTWDVLKSCKKST